MRNRSGCLMLRRRNKNVFMPRSAVDARFFNSFRYLLNELDQCGWVDSGQTVGVNTVVVPLGRS
jgi:hypothetical protein